MSPRTELIQLTNSYGAANGCFRFVGATDIIAAGIPANAILAAVALQGSTFIRWIERIRVTVTTITAFAAPLTQTRFLKVCQLSAFPTGGGGGASQGAWHIGKSAVSGGSSTAAAALSMAGTTPLTGPTTSAPMALISLVGSGNAGNVLNHDIGFGQQVSNCAVSTGFLGIAALNAFDAGGTFQLQLEVDYEDSDFT